MTARPLLLDAAREGDAKAIATLLRNFVAEVQAGTAPDAETLRYVADQLEAQLAGVDRSRALGLPRRRPGRPSRRASTFSAMDWQLEHDSKAKRQYSLARGVVKQLAEGVKPYLAWENVAGESGLTVRTVRYAYELWGPFAQIDLMLDVVCEDARQTLERKRAEGASADAPPGEHEETLSDADARELRRLFHNNLRAVLADGRWRDARRNGQLVLATGRWSDAIRKLSRR